MGGISVELVFPAEGRVPSDDFVILGQAEGECIFVGVAHLVEFFDAEVVVAGSEDELEADFVIEECGDCL